MNSKTPITAQPKAKADEPHIDLPDELIRKVEQQLPPEFRRLPHDVREQAIEVTAALSVEYLGNVPPPFIMEGWEKVLPGSADRFMRMAERDQEAFLSDIADRRRRDDRFRLWGLFAGAVVILAQFGCAIIALQLAYPYISGAFLATGVGSVVVGFLQFMRDGLSQKASSEKAAPQPAPKPRTPRQQSAKGRRK